MVTHDPALLPLPEPAGTLHDNGYWTLKNALDASRFAGWKRDHYTAEQMRAFGHDAWNAAIRYARTFAKELVASAAQEQPMIPPGMKLVPVEDPRAMDDLAALVGRLAHSLKNAVPDSELPSQALDYLRRNRLQGSPLREGDASAAQPQTDVPSLEKLWVVRGQMLAMQPHGPEQSTLRESALKWLTEAITELAAASAAQPAQPEAWQKHARELVKWRHCMSYNDSYFGEPAGLLKQLATEFERLLPPHELAAAGPAAGTTGAAS